MGGEPQRSGWSRVALLLGVVWFVLTAIGAGADYAMTRPEQLPPQAMFGGHIIALLLLAMAPVAFVAVAVTALIAVIQSRRSHGAIVGMVPALVGVLLVALGTGLSFWAFVQ